MRRAQRNARGFALFAVILLLAVMTAAVALSLDEAVDSIQNAGRVRSAEIIKAGLDEGVARALENLYEEDPATLVNPGNDWDIFKQAEPVNTIEYLPPYDYPPAGDHANEYRVRIGLRAGQRTRPPEGEDVTKAFGQIVEIQISLDANGTAGAGNPPAEERVAVGVLIPSKAAHAQ